MKITFSGTYDECLDQAHRFVESARALEPKLNPEPTITIESEVKGRVFKMGKPIDVYIGSRDTPFVLFKRFCSLEAAAHYIGVKSSSNLHPALKNGTIYKGIYNFFYHA